MNCKNCGAVVEELDARFCYACGSPIVREENDQSNEIPVIKPEDVDVYPAKPITVTVKEIPENDGFGRGLFIALSVIFGLITLTLTIMELIHFAGREDVLGYLINIAFSAVISVIIVIYSISKSRKFSIIKGVFVLGLAVEHFIFEGFSYIKYSLSFYNSYNTVTDGKNIIKTTELSDVMLATVLIITFILLYMYLIIDVIKSIFRIEQFSAFHSIMGYFVVLLFIVLSALLVILWKKELRLNFIPMYTYMITLVTTLIFANISRSKVSNR